MYLQLVGKHNTNTESYYYRVSLLFTPSSHLVSHLSKANQHNVQDLSGPLKVTLINNCKNVLLVGYQA